jgi:hypothetical protein
VFSYASRNSYTDLTQPAPAVTTLRLTHNVEVEVVALPVPFRVVADTGVVPSASSAHSLKDQALVADYDTLTHVVVKDPALKQTNT